MNCSEKSTKEWLEKNGYIKGDKVLKDLTPANYYLLNFAKKKFGKVPEAVYHNDILTKTKSGKIKFYDVFFNFTNNQNTIIENKQKEYQKIVEEAKNQELEDAKRAGISEEDWKQSNRIGYAQFPGLENQSLPPSTTNNFNDYYENKKNLLERLQEKLHSYRLANKSNYGTDKYKKEVGSFNDAIERLKDEIENLDVNKPEIVFDTVVNEINYLSNLIDTKDIHNISNEELYNRMNFLKKMITGSDMNNELSDINYKWDGSSYPDFDSKIKVGIIDLIEKYNNNSKEILMELIKDDVVISNLKDKLPDDVIEKLFESRKDVFELEKYFGGINFSNGTIIDTLLHSIWNTNVQRSKQFSRDLDEDLRDADSKLIEQGFDFDKFIEKDKDGVLTKNIINKFTTEYAKTLNQYYSFRNKFNYTSDINKKDDAYKKVISSLRENQIVIDPRRLSIFKNIYGSEYSQHFKFSDSEMLAYENELKNLLGKTYDSHIKEIEMKLKNFENQKMVWETSGSKWKDKNINRNSPWVFIDNYYSSNAFNQVEYKSGQNTYFVHNLNDSYLHFIPKKTKEDVDTGENIDTGFYNEAFNEIEQNDDAFKYWQTISKLYTEHINPTYKSQGQDISSMSWAKVQQSFFEQMSRAKENGVFGLLKGLYKYTADLLKGVWFEKGYYTDENGIKSNYNDSSAREVNKYKKIYSLKSISDIQKIALSLNIPYENLSKLTDGLSLSEKKATEEIYKKELIDKISRYKVLNNYSKDLTKATLALSNLAALHKARKETVYATDMLLKYNKNIKDKKGKNRSKSQSKLESWVDSNIYNKRAVSRGNSDEIGNKESKKIKLYTDVERDIKKILETLKSNDNLSDNTSGFNFNIDGFNYKKQGNKFTVTDKNTNIEKESTKEEFEKNLEDYFDSEVEKMGIGITPSSFFVGLMKVKISQSLALNPISGARNRIEGHFTNMIRDNSGDYWTRGNLKWGKRFMAGANLLKFTPSKLNFKSANHRNQMVTFQKLIDRLSLYQDKKNELDRKNSESRFDKYNKLINPFQFAVDNPEFKNQGELILAKLMDFKIKDNEGNEFSFFDGEGFPAYIPGTTKLRPEFKNDNNINWETFMLDENNKKSNDFFIAQIQIQDLINKTQGNYSDLDSIKMTDTNWGKMMMMFMRWFPEHANQRFSIRENDVVQGKKKVIGRHRAMLSHPGVLGIYSTIVATTALGPIAGLSAGVMLPFAARILYKKYFKGEDFEKGIVEEAMITIDYMKQVLLQTLNTPIKLAYTTKNLEDISLGKKLDTIGKNEYLSEEEQNALRGSAMGLALTLNTLIIGILAKSLLWDEDDEKDDERRMFHNFVDNNVNTIISQLTIWSKPKQLFEDTSKFALLRSLGDITKLLSTIWDYSTKGNKTSGDIAYQFIKGVPVVPLPNTVNKAIFKGELPGLDKREYQGGQWFDDYVKGSEYMAERELRNKRKEIKEEYKDYLREKFKKSNMSKESLKKAVDKYSNKRMNYSDVKRVEGETYEQAMDRIDFKNIKKEMNK